MRSASDPYPDRCPQIDPSVAAEWAYGTPELIGESRHYLFHPLELEANVFVQQVDAGMPF